MKFYVAGKFTDAARIRWYMDRIEELGHTITEDWTPNYKKTVAPDFAVSNSYMSNCALKDMIGVKTADVLLAIMDDPSYEYKGTWTEIGMAIGAGKNVAIFHPMAYGESEQTKNVFFHLHRVKRYRNWKDVVAAFGTGQKKDMCNNFFSNNSKQLKCIR